MSIEGTDGSDAEIEVNWQLLSGIGFRLGPQNTLGFDFSLNIFFDFIIEARERERLNGRDNDSCA
jgi:hypothetical protein